MKLGRSVPCLTLVVGAALASACATNPATGKRQLSLMSEEQELAIGQQQDAEIRKEMGVYSDRRVQEYVTDVGLRLAQVSERPNLPWHFTVVDVPAINAFALPGGYIYITRGIMPFLQDESQLAGVLGHEIGHVTARHASEQYSRSTGAQLGLVLGSIFVPGGAGLAQLGGSGLGLLFLKYSRDDEAQADGLGVRYAARAGWDPSGVPLMLNTLGRIEETSDDRGVPNWMATHPAADDRVQRVQSAVRDAEAGATRFTTDRDGYTRRLDGLVFGDSPNQGVVRNGSYLHAGLRLGVDFPRGWPVSNGEAEVVATEAGTSVQMVLVPVLRPQGRTLEGVARLSMQRAGFRTVSGQDMRINGMDAYVATFVGSMQRAGHVTVRAAFLAQYRRVYLLAGIAPEDLFEHAEPVFMKSIESFRSLTAGDAESIRPNIIALYTAQPGDTWQAIAERAGKDKEIVKPTTLAIMNGHRIDDQPQPGEKLKIVVSG
jgi:predicted Zn-dependent protease